MTKIEKEMINDERISNVDFSRAGTPTITEIREEKMKIPRASSTVDN